MKKIILFYFLAFAFISCDSYTIEYDNPIACNDLINNNGLTVYKGLPDKKYSGSCYEYSSEGLKTELKSFTKGIPHGMHLGYYYPEETILFKGFKKKGEIHGEYVRYHKNGQINMKGKFKNGYYTGKWNYFNEKGDIDERKTYFQGIESESEKF